MFSWRKQTGRKKQMSARKGALKKMTLSEKRDLTTGDVKKKLLSFTLPIVMTLLLQALYNVVDMIIVGQHLGASGMSAVSTGG